MSGPEVQRSTLAPAFSTYYRVIIDSVLQLKFCQPLHRHGVDEYSTKFRWNITRPPGAQVRITNQYFLAHLYE